MSMLWKALAGVWYMACCTGRVQQVLGEERLIGWQGETHHIRGEGSKCVDIDDNCEDWANGGECAINPGFMRPRCPLSCRLCKEGSAVQGGGASPTEVRPKFGLSTDGTKPYTVKLANGVVMPQIGFGTAGLGCEKSYSSVLIALEVGYRHLDTAQANEWYCEESVGRAIIESGVPRSELFLVTKQHPRDFGFDRTHQMFATSLANLRTDHIDLFHLHYPQCWGDLCKGAPPTGTWRDAWRALEDLYNQGRIRALGVSNFSPSELSELLRFAKVKPMVVQSHSDPLVQNRALQELAAAEGIVFTAYSSLGTQHGWERPNPVLNNAVIAEIASLHAKSPAQVILRWALQHNQVVIPRSTSRVHMQENLDLASFALLPDDRDQIDRLDGTKV